MKHFLNPLILLLLFLTISISSNPSLAEDVERIYLPRALEEAFKNNLDLKIAQLTLMNSEMEWEKGKLSSNADLRSQKLNLDLNLAKSQNSYRTARYNMIYNLINDFLELTKKRLTIEINEKMLQIKELELKEVEMLYTRGNATDSELMEARVAVKEQELVLHKSKEDLNKLEDSLKAKIGMGKNVQFMEITPKIVPLEIDLDAAIEEALSTNFDVKEKEINYQLAALDLERATVEGRSKQEIEKLTNNKEIAFYRFLQSKDNLIQKVKEELKSLEEALKTIEFKSDELEMAQESYRQTSIGYDRGFYTETQLLQSRISLLNAEKALFTAQADYILKTIQVLNLLGREELIGGELK